MGERRAATVQMTVKLPERLWRRLKVLAVEETFRQAGTPRHVKPGDLIRRAIEQTFPEEPAVVEEPPEEATGT